MKISSEIELKNVLKSNEIGGLYFIYGNESYLKMMYANKIAHKAVQKEFEVFNIHFFDGRVTSVDKIAEAVEAMPMFSDKTCVVVNDLPIHEFEQTQIDNLEAVITDIPRSCALILLMDTVEKKEKKEKKGSIENTENENETINDTDKIISEEKSKKENVWDIILKIAVEKGYAIELNKKTNSELAEIVTSGAKKRGYIISNDTARYLVENVGNDLSNLQNELNKVCSFVKSEAITRSDIDKVAVKSIEAKIFDMAKFLIEKKYDEAYRILDTLFSQKTEPTLIVGTLISPFIDIYRVKLAIIAGEKAINVAKNFDYKGKEFKLTNSVGYASRISVAQLRKCLSALDDADAVLKRQSNDSKIIIEQTMARMLLAMDTK